jgi:YgiT-type zinc finger domain-containing protein
MKCGICGSRTRLGKTTVTVDRRRQVVVVRNVPARVCSLCGEAWLTDASAATGEKVVQRAGKDNAQLEVVSLGARRELCGRVGRSSPMRYIARTALLAFSMILPCLGGTYVLDNGRAITGSVVRTSADGMVTIRTETGVLTYRLDEFDDYTTDWYFSDLKASIERARAAPARTARTEPSVAKPGPGSINPMATSVKGLIAAGLLVLAIGGLWMIVAAFAVSPVWGIAFILSAFIAQLAFIFVHWDRAKSPLLTQFLGILLLIGAFLLAR